MYVYTECPTGLYTIFRVNNLFSNQFGEIILSPRTPHFKTLNVYIS